MRAVAYTEPGGPEVLHVVERPVPEPGPGEVRVRIVVSGVNPTDWKARRSGRSGRSGGGLPFPEIVPNQDGAGTIDAVGDGVPSARIGERVWIWEATYRRAEGTAQEAVVVPARQAVPLPAGASFDVGASLGIPALTAQICLTAADDGPRSLGPGALAGRTVLVAGGAGAVGHASIQLSRWAGAHVIATVSGEEKGSLARAGGAHHVVSYRDEAAAEEIRGLAPNGVSLIVEVAPAVNAALDAAVLAPGGTVAVYATDGGGEVALEAWPLMLSNARYRFMLVYTVPPAVKDQAVRDVSAAVADEALPVGAEVGLPLHRFPLERTGDAHEAVERGAVGKVLVDIG